MSTPIKYYRRREIKLLRNIILYLFIIPNSLEIAICMIVISPALTHGRIAVEALTLSRYGMGDDFMRERERGGGGEGEGRKRG